MDQAQTRLMAVLAVLLGVVSTASWWFDSNDADPPDADATVDVWKVAAEEVHQIEITRAVGALVLTASESGWQVTEPETFDADPERVRALLGALASIERGVPIVGTDPAEFGLGDPPVATVTLRSKAGAAQVLVFGHDAPVGWSTYARTAQGTMVAVPGKPGADLSAGPEHFRDRRILGVVPGDVRALTLAGPEGVLSVRGVERAVPVVGVSPLAWWLDGFTRADPDAVDDLLTGLLMLRFEEITPQAPPISLPLHTVRIETPQRAWVLRVGPTDGSYSPVEVEGGLSGTVLSDALGILGMGPTDLGDSRAFPYDPDSTDRIEIVSGQRRWVSVRNGSAWQVDGKDSLPALDVAGVVDGAAIAYTREPVLPPVSVAFTVILGEGPSQTQVEVGPASGDFAAARDLAGGAPYRVPEQDLAPLRRLFGE